MQQNARRAVQPYTKEQFGLSVVRLYAAGTGPQIRRPQCGRGECGMIKKINQAASILGLVLCAVLAYGFWKAGLFDSKEALTSCISRFGWAGPAVFITFQAVQVVIPILPGGLGCLAGVILFGAWKGFWYNYIGICAGSLGSVCHRPRLRPPAAGKRFSCQGDRKI